MARDARVKWLPKTLPTKPDYLWQAELAGDGIGGIAVAEGCVVVASRDALDSFDVIQAFDAKSGKSLWKHIYQAKGSLDYGNSARATPLIQDGNVYTLGAFGDLYCLELESGLPLWHRNLIEEFGSQKMTWGHSGSPLIVDGKLIVQPGGKTASLVALDPDTGETLWESAGGAASYSSFVSVPVGKQHQLVGFDFESLGGWDLQTGKRLWKHSPSRPGDFNVPTVLIHRQDSESRLIVASENNGTRLMQFEPSGVLADKPLAQTRELAPDTHTPVLAGNMVVGVWTYLYAIRISDQFKTIVELEDVAFEQYCSLISSGDRVLVLSMDGELLLVEVSDNQLKINSRLKLAAEPSSVYSHPAVADNGMYLRLGKKLVKLRLGSES